MEKEEEKIPICRICLNYDSSESGKRLSLFEKYQNKFIFEKIRYIANIEIKKGDNLPDKICPACLLALNNACSFKEKCETSNAILHSALRLAEPIREQFKVHPIKVENEYDYECNYLSDNTPSPLGLIKTQECIDTKPPSKVIQAKLVPFKSKAIDLHLECHDCGGFFKSKCKLRVHWKKVHQPKQLTCPICKKILKTYKSFHSHMKRRSKRCRNAEKVRVEGEGRSRIYYCKECGAHSSRIQTIMAHLVRHTGERPYVCNICNKTFTQHSSLAGHKEAAHKTYSKEGTCHQCGKYFKGRNKLYRHMQTHTKGQFPCKICFKVLSSKSGWAVHMKRHSGVKAYTCEICARSFYTSSDLGNHRAKTHLKGKVYSCDLCEYKTVNRNCMAKHHPRHNAGNVACDVCGTFVENLQQLTMHKKRHFEKNYQCTYCNKMFYGRKNLSAHIRKQHNVYGQGCGKPSIGNILEVEKSSQSV